MKPGTMSMSTKEPPLIRLVEQYLALNSNLSYINIDDMIDHFQSKFHRFARMQKKVFANQVRSAYLDYCQRSTAKQDVSTPASGFVVDCNPAEVEDDSDSDIEEIRDEPPKKDIVNSCLTTLYKSSNSQKSEAKASSTSRDDNDGPNQNKPIPSSSEMPQQVSTSTSERPEAPRRNFDNEDSMESDSDNDLEIIDEVKGDGAIKRSSDSNITISNEGKVHSVGNSAIPPGLSVSLINRDGVCQNVLSPFARESVSQNNFSHYSLNRKTNFPEIHQHSSTTQLSENGRRDKVSQSQPQPTVTARGAKRKIADSISNKGINDDLTPKKQKKEIAIVTESGYRLSDFAGSEKVVEEVCRLLMHLKHPEVYKSLGVTAPRGFLLHGPPGTGKTLLANAIAGELQLPMLKVTGTEFVSGISGESESNIRDLFNQALAIAPCIIFIDEIDSITPKRETAQKEMERRIVAQLLSCVDDLMNHERGSQVLLVGATNRIEAIDTALRRAGRFDKEISLGIPDEKSRGKILNVICRNLRLAPGFDLNVLAKLTPGYVGADLQLLVREAAVQAVNKALLASCNERTDSDLSTGRKQVIVNITHGLRLVGPSTSLASNLELKTNNELSNPTSDGNTNKDLTPNIVQSTSEPQSVSETENGNISKTLATDTDGVESTTESQTIPIPEIEKTTNDFQDEEKMEVDGSDLDLLKSSAVSPLVVSSTSSEPRQIETIKEGHEVVDGKSPSTEIRSTDMNNVHGSTEKDVESPTYLRWIKETAPLTKTELDELYIFMDDFEIALKHVQPSSKREGFATVPDTTWDDIGALSDIREELEVSILGPIKHTNAFQALGLNTPAGVLLCGPPGCGKTLLAKAVANEAGINFISVKGPELLNMYVGESERAVRQCFLRAKNSSPCVIFFDELDALCPRRSDNAESGSGSRIVNQLLTEMDGMESRQGVFVMAATNRPDILDPAILRPGRLDKILFVDLPSASDRFEILKAITKNGSKPVLSDDVNLSAVAAKESCENYTGADLAALVREASIAAFKDLVLGNPVRSNYSANDLQVTMKHFETAFLKTKPSVTKRDREKYAEMKDRYSNAGER